MLARQLEPEVMDSWDEAVDYDSMDHSAVNALFITDLLAIESDPRDVLDLGTGTAQIPLELCRRHPNCRVMAADAATNMLEIAKYNLAASEVGQRVQLTHLDAKDLPFQSEMFDVVMSNSIVHHIPEPAAVLEEAARVCAPGGLLFFRDLLRPADEATLCALVDQYASECNDHQRRMFADSLHAALSLEEIRGLVAALGFAPEDVRATSDRHWTWASRKVD